MANNINAQDMKEHNRRIILQKIRGGQYSRADLARATGLTRAAMTIIVNNLIQSGYVTEQGVYSDGKKGRNPTLLSINGAKFFSIGVNITRGTLNVGAADFACRPLIDAAVKMPHGYFRAEALEFIDAKIYEYLKIHKKARCLGIGISVPGPVSPHEGRILAPPNFSGWEGFLIKDYFETKFGIPTVVENNSNAFTLYEHLYGDARGMKNFIGVLVDEGLGSCAILDNRMYKGVNGMGMELGHVSLNADGDKCGCGSRGCAELYAAIPNILADARRKGADFRSWTEIIDAAESGEKAAIDTVSDEAKYLSRLFVSTSNTLDITDFVIFGELCYKNDILKTAVQENLKGAFLGRGTETPLLNIRFTRGAPTGGFISAANLPICEYGY